MLASVIFASAAAPQTVGYYSWNWGSGSKGPPGATTSVAFTGLVDVATAISGYTPGASWCCPPLEGEPYLSLGGGNSAGVFSATVLAQIRTDLEKILAANYSGVCFDVEEVVGPSSEVVPAFASTFAACKKLGLKVMITTSHTAPYQCDSPEDAIAMVKAWAIDPNVDVISPQLYSSGSEATPEFDATSSCAKQGCTWELYRGTTAAIAPSIVGAEQYDAVTSYFKNLSLPVSGYFEWRQRA